jgi:hypothetical protein
VGVSDVTWCIDRTAIGLINDAAGDTSVLVAIEV